jgi:hypothetical protein
MKIDMAKEAGANTFISWVICNQIGDKYMELFPNRESVENAEIKLTVNGVELDFRTTIAELDRQYEDLVKSAAGKLVEEKCKDLADLTGIIDAARKDLMRKMKEKLGIDLTEDDYY